MVRLEDGVIIRKFPKKMDFPPSSMAKFRSTLAIGFTNGELLLYDIDSGETTEEVEITVPGRPNDIAFSFDGSLLAIGYQDVSTSEGGTKVFARKITLWGHPITNSSF